MKRTIGILMVMLSPLLSSAQQVKPEIAFTLTERDLIPEGIAYDPVEKSFYVSSIFKRKIVKISARGEVKDFVQPGANELQEVLGMKVDEKGFLWACNNAAELDTVHKIANVHVYNVKTGALHKRFQLSDGKKHLFNDLCISNSGDVYVTDSEAGMVWMIRSGKDQLEEFTKPGSVPYANGITITPDQKTLLVCTGGNLGIARVSVGSKEIAPLRSERYGLKGYDGLYFYKNNLIGVQNIFFPESVNRLLLSPSGDAVIKIELLCAQEPSFDLLTTGVVVGDNFYFIANSQILELIGNKGRIKHPEKLKDVLIMKIKLN